VDGIGALGFGVDQATATATLSAALGAPIDQADAHFTENMGDHFEDEDGYAFPTEYARSVCFANDLCVWFGGGTPDALQFLGWNYAYAGEGPMPSPTLSTADGVRPGLHWADVAASLQVAPDGCYYTGFGTTAGIDVELASQESWFGSMGVDPPPVPVTPDPAEVTITLMHAGAQTTFPAEEC